MRIEYLPHAVEDLKEIRSHYLEVGGKPLALKMVRQIREEVKALADNPYLAQPYEIVPGIRRLVVADGVFLVFYGVTERIEVLHVRRAERAPATAEDMPHV
ncbi:MAG: type II toxin-antitoxin system RelE/ParE family toxin [Sulfurimicrobium sp.]|nr:type II toxin-antitoxin system RelE/ParE family toxin [Sulfurimicrobium sp.]